MTSRIGSVALSNILHLLHFLHKNKKSNDKVSDRSDSSLSASAEAVRNPLGEPTDIFAVRRTESVIVGYAL